MRRATRGRPQLLSRLLSRLVPGLVLAVVGDIALAGCSDDGNDDGVVQARAASPTPEAASYVAIGDSYSSGPLIPVTDVANGCFRSDHDYPALVAEAIGAELVDRTCSGADTRAFSQPQYPDVPPQRTGLGKDTSLVTVGLGGNDGQVFRSLTQQCPQLRVQDPQGAPCREYFRSGGGDVLLGRLARTRVALTAVLREVRRLAPNARVLAVGYPQIVDAAHVCRRLPLATGDYAYAEQVNRALAETVRQAAAAAGATYVDTWTPSRGHDICSADPWIDGSQNLQGRAPRYHPFVAYHVAVAQAVEQILDRG